MPTRRAALVALAAAVGLLLFWQGDDVVALGRRRLAHRADRRWWAWSTAWWRTSPSDLVVQRRHPPVVVAGRTVDRGVDRPLRCPPGAHGARGRPAGARACGPAPRRFRVRVPPGARRGSPRSCAPLRRGRFDIDHLTVRIEGRLGLGARQRDVALRDRAAGPPAVPLRRGGRAAHTAGPDPRGGDALGPGPGRWHGVRAAPRVRPRRRVPAHRLDGHRPHRHTRSCGPTGPSATSGCSCCWTTAGSWPAGSGASPRGARHGRGDDAHRRRHPARRPLRPRGLRPRRARPWCRRPGTPTSSAG